MNITFSISDVYIFLAGMSISTIALLFALHLLLIKLSEVKYSIDRLAAYRKKNDLNITLGE